MTFPMKAGDTKRIYMTITTPEGQPIDLTDATIRWWASKGNVEQFSRSPILQKSMGDGIEEVALMDGQFFIHLAPADTQALNGSYYYEIEIQDEFGNVSTPIADSFTVTKDLIR